MVWEVNKEAAERRQRPWRLLERPLEKVRRFLLGQDEEIAPTMMDMLPIEVQGPTANFYKF